MAFLTIAVPTFNRADDLTLLLGSIQTELATVTDCDIEVLVVSNASTDGTDNLAAHFSQTIPGFRYLKNDTNIGLQANLVRCLRESTGRYTWMIGDDEFLEPGGMRVVVNSLREYSNNALFIFNYSSEPSPSGERFLQQVNNRDLVTSQQPVIDFVTEKGWLWTLGNLGMVVVETAKLMHVDPTPHMGSAFAQAGWYLEALHRESLVYVHEPVFRTRIKSQTVNKERWQTDGTADSFHHVNSSLDRFAQLGITGKEVPIMFLNVCSNNRLPLWNLFLNPIVQRLSAGNFHVEDREWNTMFSLIERVAEPDIREAMSAYLNTLRRSITATKLNFENSIWLLGRFRPNLFYGTV